MRDASVVSVLVGTPQDLQTTRGVVSSSISRGVIPGRVAVGREGVAGNEQGDTVNHGGDDKAICVYLRHQQQYWEVRLGRILPAGSFGENLLIAGLDEGSVCIGDIFSIGTVRVQVSQPRQPCYKLAAHHGVKQLADWVIAHGSTGFYFRVLDGGEIWADAPVQARARPHPELTIAEANRVMHHAKDDHDAIRRLLVPELSASWMTNLRRRLGE